MIGFLLRRYFVILVFLLSTLSLESNEFDFRIAAFFPALRHFGTFTAPSAPHIKLRVHGA